MGSAIHAPTLEANTLAGLHISIAGKPLAFRRDPLDPYAYRVDVPAGAQEIEVSFDYLSPIGGGPKVMTPAMIALLWSHAMLCPAGWYVRDILVQANLSLPPGFDAHTSLDPSPGPCKKFAKLGTLRPGAARE